MPARDREMTRDEFADLCDRWHRETQHFSSISQKTEHETFKAIVAGGRKVLPWVFERILYDDRTHWFLLAHAITGESPFPDCFRGKTAAIRAFWFVHGYDRGYFDPAMLSREGCKTNSETYFEKLKEHGLAGIAYDSP